MRVVFAGTPAAAAPSLRALHASAHEVVCVVTRPPARKGRGRKLEASAIAVAAEELELPLLAPADLRDVAFVAKVRALEPDCCPVVAYGSLVTPELLAIPRFGWVNVHFSLLPAWRGAAPIQHAILHGDDITGVTTFLLEEGLDTGPIYGQVTEPIQSTDTAADLTARLSESGAHLLINTLDAIAGGSATAREQPTQGVSFAPKLRVVDARVIWDHSAVNINRLIRACFPSPGAWTVHEDARIKLLGSAIVNASDLSPGELRVQQGEVLVGCGISAVRLEQVQPEGRRAMPAGDWVRGLRRSDGLTLR